MVNVMLLPAMTFLYVEVMSTANIVGLPVEGSQSAKYSIMPKGRPATSDGLFSIVCAVLFGNEVDSTPMFSYRSILLAITVDSRTVGKWKPLSTLSAVGFSKMYSGD